MVYFGIAVIVLAVVGLAVAQVYVIVWMWPEFVRQVRNFWDPKVFFSALGIFGLIFACVMLVIGLSNCVGDLPAAASIPDAATVVVDVDDPSDGGCEPTGHQCTLVTTCCADSSVIDGMRYASLCNFGDGGDANYYGTCMPYPHAE